MIATLGIGFLTMCVVQAAGPQNIAGKWSGDSWSQIVLTETSAGNYVGTFTDSVYKATGKIELSWSPLEHCFTGTWSERDNRAGELSIRLVDKEIRGAIIRNQNSPAMQGEPRLADLMWTAGKTNGASLPPIAASKPPFEARLASGAVVELVGVAKKNPKDRVWWQPNGLPLQDRPYDFLQSKGIGSPPPGDHAVYEFVFRLKNAPSDTQMDCFTRPSSPTISYGTPMKDGWPTKDVRGLAISLPAKNRIATVELRLATGQWQTVAEIDNGWGFNRGGQDQADRFGVNVCVTMDNRVIATAVHTLDTNKQQARYLAVGKDGRDHNPQPLRGSFSLYPTPMSFDSLAFPDLAPDDIQTIRLQARSRELIEFRDVSLQAGQKTDVQIIGGDDSSSSATPNGHR